TITEFIFQAINLFHYDKTLHSLSEALQEFHHYKFSILSSGGRRGKNGPLNHFKILKLKLAQHVAQSTHTMGAPYQWSSDITKRCHITHIKWPYHMSNHKDFHGQCCHFLDWQEKLQFFQLYTILKSQQAGLIYEMSREANMMVLHYPKATWILQFFLTSSISAKANQLLHFSAKTTLIFHLMILSPSCSLATLIIPTYLSRRLLKSFTFLIFVQHWVI
ncbi:hypothetical protein EDB19DRAFT_1628400, partial [Suillus lakei]